MLGLGKIADRVVTGIGPSFTRAAVFTLRWRQGAAAWSIPFRHRAGRRNSIRNAANWLRSSALMALPSRAFAKIAAAAASEHGVA